MKKKLFRLAACVIGCALTIALSGCGGGGGGSTGGNPVVGNQNPAIFSNVVIPTDNSLLSGDSSGIPVVVNLSDTSRVTKVSALIQEDGASQTTVIDLNPISGTEYSKSVNLVQFTSHPELVGKVDLKFTVKIMVTHSDKSPDYSIPYNATVRKLEGPPGPPTIIGQ